ncbi:NUDIX hydrolase [Rhizobium sp. H4]|uniref:NUDIX hydrolase n=1 Tax=Rhizobium sp. H4 TaxID=2035449 RepID=UPI001FE19B8E|nr:NUDIX hydrolase [Rhizobium sp. H4]
MKKVATHFSRLAGHTKTILTGGSAQQYGALCFRKTPDSTVEVLLVTTRDTGRWTIPKGWPIKGLAPHEVAERQAWEEAGVKGRVKKRVFGHFVYIKALTGERYLRFRSASPRGAQQQEAIPRMQRTQAHLAPAYKLRLVTKVGATEPNHGLSQKLIL